MIHYGVAQEIIGETKGGGEGYFFVFLTLRRAGTQPLSPIQATWCNMSYGRLPPCTRLQMIPWCTKSCGAAPVVGIGLLFPVHVLMADILCDIHEVVSMIKRVATSRKVHLPASSSNQTSSTMGAQGTQSGGEGRVYSLSCMAVSRRLTNPRVHPNITETDQVGFSPTRQDIACLRRARRET